MAEMEKKTVNAMGDVCPVPLVKAKNAIAELAGSGKVEVLVDNEIAVQNLEKMAQQKGYGFLVKEKKEKEVAALNRMIAELLGISSTETMKLPNKVYSSNQFKAACRGAK